MFYSKQAEEADGDGFQVNLEKEIAELEKSQDPRNNRLTVTIICCCVFIHITLD